VLPVNIEFILCARLLYDTKFVKFYMQLLTKLSISKFQLTTATLSDFMKSLPTNNELDYNSDYS